jgi:hypothetical protein
VARVFKESTFECDDVAEAKLGASALKKITAIKNTRKINALLGFANIMMSPMFWLQSGTCS